MSKAHNRQMTAQIAQVAANRSPGARPVRVRPSDLWIGSALAHGTPAQARIRGFDTARGTVARGHGRVIDVGYRVALRSASKSTRMGSAQPLMLVISTA
jgi:hypothetical protein